MKPILAYTEFQTVSYFIQFIRKSNRYDLDIFRSQSFRHNYTNIFLLTIDSTIFFQQQEHFKKIRTCFNLLTITWKNVFTVYAFDI